MPVSGLFTLETSQIRISRVAFHYSWLPTTRAASTSSLTSRLPVLRIAPDRRALDARTLLPLDRASCRPTVTCFVLTPSSFPPSFAVRLDSQPVVLLEISTGRNDVAKATVGMRVPDEELTFDVGQARIISGGASSSLLLYRAFSWPWTAADISFRETADVKTFSVVGETVTLEGLAADSVVVVSFPYRGSPSGTSVPVSLIPFQHEFNV